MLVSHNTDVIKQWCDKVVYMSEGKLMMYGEPNKTIKQYLNETELTNKKSGIKLDDSIKILGMVVQSRFLY